MKRTVVHIGIDLHSNHLMLAAVDAEGVRQGHHRLPCELGQVLACLRA